MLHTTLEKCLVYVNREKKVWKRAQFCLQKYGLYISTNGTMHDSCKKRLYVQSANHNGAISIMKYDYNFHVSKFHEILNFSMYTLSWFPYVNRMKTYRSSTATFENIWPLKCVEDHLFLPSRIYSRPIS